MTMQNPSKFKENIKTFISEDDIEIAFDELHKNLYKDSKRYDELIQIKGQFSKFKHDKISGAYSNDSERQCQNQIRNQLLEFLNILTPNDFIYEAVNKPADLNQENNNIHGIDTAIISGTFTCLKDVFQYILTRTLQDDYCEITFFDSGHTGWYYKAKTKKNPKKDMVIVVLKVFSTSDLPQEEEIDKIVDFSGDYNITRIVNYGFTSLPAYVVMDYKNGITLEKALDLFGGFPLTEALEIMKKLVSSLSWIRKNEILHTNIRPSKIYIDEQGFPWISPLDILKFGNFKDNLRSISRFKEDCRYLSEEALDLTLDTGDKNAVEKSDQFSLGLLLLEMIGGKPLFYENTVSKIFERRHEFFKAPQELLDKALEGKKCDKLLKKLLIQMLSKNPIDRCKGGLSEVIDKLQKISSHTLAESPLLYSFHKCYSDNKLTEEFYKRLFKKLPEVSSHFSSMGRQYMMLRFAVFVIFEIEQKKKFFRKILENERHKPYSDLHYYKTFLETLRDTVKELLQKKDDWNEKTMLPAWDGKIRETLSEIENYLKESLKDGGSSTSKIKP